MARHKDFSGGTKIEDFEPLTFSLNGETFTCVPAIQGTVLLEFVAAADSQDGGAAATALYQFFKDCMSASEYERFDRVLKNPEVIIDMETIGEIAGWLVEEYTQRPTRQPATSASGQLTSNPTSTEPPL